MAKSDDMMQKVGSWAFIFGLIVAVLAGVISSPQWAPMIVLALGILGLIVGFLNVTARESTPFLVAAIALVTSSSGLAVVLTTLPSLAGVPIAGVIASILSNISVFVAPAAVLVALRSIYALASTE